LKQIFPASFSFHIHNWNPVDNCRTWWNQYYWAVAVGVLVTLVLGLSIFGVWLIRRERKGEHGSYEPVGAIVPEQELQPLQTSPAIDDL
jgi:hypothetical protein